MRPGRIFLALAAIFSNVISGLTAQNQMTPAAVVDSVSAYLASYICDVDLKTPAVQKVTVSEKDRRLDVFLGQTFSFQRFRPQLIDSICAGISRRLPPNYSKYSVSVSSNGYTLEQMVPGWLSQSAFDSKNEVPAVRPWKTNESAAVPGVAGLAGWHLCVTPSHGLYYDREDTIWKFQRPALYCSREDLLTQSIVYPYLIPMLENAGAVVLCTRERDWQENQVIVGTRQGGDFREKGTWKRDRQGGYSFDSLRILPDSYKVNALVSAAGPDAMQSTAMWIPNIPRDGDYAVYVTYRSDPSRVDDARYIVYHSGGSTVYRVNQQIGGGTWLYLGTFNFKKGQSPQGMVSLDNSSAMNGTVCADAVRFGGGTVSETREGIDVTAPRYLYGTRYYARFAGAPDSVTMKYLGADDYREDIWSRPFMANWVAGTSDYNRKGKGLGVPVGLYFSLHTDAGYHYSDSVYGSIGICTTASGGGRYASGHDRITGREFADMALSELMGDYKAATGKDWAWRGIWDRDYCESRETSMPSIMVELLSHQSFWDMKLALNPNFQFLAARSLYKAILKQIHYLYGGRYAVQPLPVNHFQIVRKGDRLTLSWRETADSQEPTAVPTAYIVYQSVDGQGFDNGTMVRRNSFDVIPQKGHIYRFKVAAWNEGGQSMDSEILSASIVDGSKRTVLVVNGFDRLGPPEVIQDNRRMGFDIDADAGVQYRRSPILCGRQQVFDRSLMDLDEKNQTGASDSSLEGQILAGNSFDYPYIHGQSLVQAGCSFVSCSRDAFADGFVSMRDYAMTDLILGFQKKSDADSDFGKDYSCFPKAMRQRLDEYLTEGGRLMVSGSYPASDLMDASEMEFARKQLHYSPSAVSPDWECDKIVGKKIAGFQIQRQLNSEVIAVQHPDALTAENHGERLLSYDGTRLAAAIGYKSAAGRSVVLGFPFECITSKRERDHVMRYIMDYLIDK